MSGVLEHPSTQSIKNVFFRCLIFDPPWPALGPQGGLSAAVLNGENTQSRVGRPAQFMPTQANFLPALFPGPNGILERKPHSSGLPRVVPLEQWTLSSDKWDKSPYSEATSHAHSDIDGVVKLGYWGSFTIKVDLEKGSGYGENWE